MLIKSKLNFPYWISILKVSREFSGSLTSYKSCNLIPREQPSGFFICSFLLYQDVRWGFRLRLWLKSTAGHTAGHLWACGETWHPISSPAPALAAKTGKLVAKGVCWRVGIPLSAEPENRDQASWPEGHHSRLGWEWRWSAAELPEQEGKKKRRS